MIARTLEVPVQEWMSRGKAIVVVGPRQVGKTTLVKAIAEKSGKKVLWLTGDDPATRTLLEGISLERLKVIVGNHTLVVVDEAQRMRDIGLTLKLIADHLPQVQLLVTGSSSLDLASQTRESLVGRKAEFVLYPISFAEMVAHQGYLSERSLLEHRMVYGYYPEVVTHDLDYGRRVLMDLVDGLMYKDLLTLEQLKKPTLLVKLLQALALQVGQEVRYSELAHLIGSDPGTVERYIHLLEETFVVFRLPSFSRNLRNEIKKGRKVYFFDTGIRNALIKNFSPLELRQDVGALWENFLVVERMKRHHYAGHPFNAYFWRTTAQQEIDYLEESGGKLKAYAFKWNPRKRAPVPITFRKAYPEAETHLVTPQNFESFLGLEGFEPM
ncbi:MAG: ATP-binding protein [Bacteroidetes bacterium]|nr:MAG: ATP-binding protein [Bacteroidota bacterium]